MATCTGCSLLCEDIEVALKDGAISQVRNLCRKGYGHFQALLTERTAPMVDGHRVSLDEAIAEAARILKGAERPLLYGWSNSALEAQSAGIDLAERLGATIDDTSSICQGLLLERVLRGELPTCTLDDVRNYADTSIFWGSDPSNSHPRHLSRFAYYPRGEKRQKGYEEERVCIAVDVRRSATARLCGSYYYQIPPGGDAAFIEALSAVLDGKIPKFGDKKRMIELGSVLRKTEYGAIFPGLGLVYSLQERMDLLVGLVARLNEISEFKVLPMVGHYNMRGFNQLLLDRTGFINSVSFRDDGPVHGAMNGVMGAARSCDAALVIGTDPLSSLPYGTARALAGVPMVAIDPRRSLTTDSARVVIPTAMYGLEAGGTALRMDGQRIAFEPFVGSDLPSDEQVLMRIMEAI
ncbi:MAG: formylmethanofuran dehydrogenase subunit B [Methanothrix sp.]|nr:formylmethanofuran dehydrogenase subunit B [Methanothrix sp.]